MKQTEREREMGNTVWASVTWHLADAPLITRIHPVIQCGPLITGIHQSTLITDRFIHSCIIDKSVYYALYYVYWPAHRWETGRESIITQLGRGDKNLLILGKFLNPDVGKEIPVILEKNCWFCWNLWTFEIARDRIEEPESACVGIWG